MTLLERDLRSRSLGSLIRCIALDETKLSEKGLCTYMVCCRCGFKGITGFGSPYVGSFFNVLSFLKKALKMCTNKPLVIVDKGSWYRWSLERLGLEYRHERFGIRNRVERFFRYLK
jgi:putative transposase